MTSNYLLRQAEALLHLSRATLTSRSPAGCARWRRIRAKAQELERGHIPGELAPAKHSSQH